MLPFFLVFACGPQSAGEFLDTAGPIDEDGDGWPALVDCNDQSASVHPNAEETCDSRDEDCDGEVDEGAGPTWFLDNDGDSHGDPRSWQQSCTAPDGYVSNDDDCDDDNAEVHPGAADICNYRDDDCDNLFDEAGTDNTYYSDADGDGYGDPEVTVLGCYVPEGAAEEGSDCDDADATRHPGAEELCDGIDQDCDDLVDDGVLGTSSDCPVTHCAEILSGDSGAATGTYWIDLGGSSPFEIVCDMEHAGGGWTLAAHIDDVLDPYFGALREEPWEGTDTRNADQLPSYGSSLGVSARYAPFSGLVVTDVLVYYANDDVSFSCEDLSAPDTLNELFKIVPARGSCTSVCTTWTDDRMPSDEPSADPAGINCSDGNQDWMNETYAENARIGAYAANHQDSVMNAYLGAAGDRGFDTSAHEKTWAAYEEGMTNDDNIYLYVR